MKTPHYISLLAVALLTAFPVLAHPPGPDSDWEVKFQDDFSGAISSARWKWPNSAPGGYSDNADGSMVQRWNKTSSHVWTQDGKLVLKISEPQPGKIDCGRLESFGVREFTYGYWECSMKTPPSWKGVQSSFWIKNYPNGDPSQSTNEVDIIESWGYNSQYSTGVHKGINGAPGHEAWGVFVPIGNAAKIDEAYHVYGLEWTSNALRFYFNNTLKRTFTTARGIPGGGVDMPVILSTEAFTAIAGDSSTTQFPLYAYVDWVKVWQRK